METITELRLALNAGKATAFIWEIPPDEDWRLHGIASALNATADPPEKFEAVVAKVHPEDWDSFERNVRETLDRPGDDYSNEYRLVEPDGRVRWIEDIGRVEFYQPRRRAGVPVRRSRSHRPEHQLAHA